MTAQVLSAAAAIFVSLILAYVGPARLAWDKLKGDTKRLILLLIFFLIAAGAFAITCSGFADQFDLSLTCDELGAISLLKSFVIAAVSNQTTYSLIPTSRKK